MSILPVPPLNILVVEDNYTDYLLLSEFISLAGIPTHGIKLAETITAAASFLANNKPDLVFLDLYLPDSTGLSTFSELKKHLVNSTVIILSGISDTKTALEAIAEGAQDYLSKGEFDEKLLNKTVKYGIERRRSQEKIRQANERYELAIKATNDLIWDWDLVTGEIYRDEEAVKQVYGVSCNNTIKTIEQFSTRIHSADLDRVNKAIEEMKHSAIQDVYDMEYQFLSDDGHYRCIYDRGIIVRNAEGKPVRIIGAAQDMTEKRKLEKALQESQRQQQRAIAEATIKGQENEREQMGIELHDNINQILASSKLYLDHALSQPSIETNLVRESKQLICLATEEIRKLSHALLPPSFNEFGLIQALEELTAIMARTDTFIITRQWNHFQEMSLQRDQKLTIYRIVQEQLNNIIKHAEATQVLISLNQVKTGHGFELVIKDNGKGFDTSRKRDGVGLRNIISRAELFFGNVIIKSEPSKGCELKVIFPAAPHLAGLSPY